MTNEASKARRYTEATKKALSALSGGHCYFPGCYEPIIRFIEGRPETNCAIAHIRDASEGNRYVATMTVDERRDFSNLILLCHPHHNHVDKTDPERYPAEVLDQWKTERESELLSRLFPTESERIEARKTYHTELNSQHLINDVKRAAIESQIEYADLWNAHNREVRQSIEDFYTNSTQSAFLRAFICLRQYSILSEKGCRVRFNKGSFYLRLSLLNKDSLILYIDTKDTAALMQHNWYPNETFAQAVHSLMKELKKNANWPGDDCLDLEKAICNIRNMLLECYSLRSNGIQIENAIQWTEDGHILTETGVTTANRRHLEHSKLEEIRNKNTMSADLEKCIDELIELSRFVVKNLR